LSSTAICSEWLRRTGLNLNEYGDLKQEYPIPIDAEIDSAQTIRERRIFHLADIEHNPNATALDREYARLAGYRTRLMVPMMRADKAVGLIAVTRQAPTPFADHEIELLKTSAEQAVIAIENVRLFKELEARNKDLTESLEQQTATSEILRVISSSPTDLAPVFETILANASRLSGANLAALWRFDGEQMIGPAHYNASPEFAHRIMPEPVKPGRQGPARQAALERRVVHVVDMMIEPGYSPVLLQFERARTNVAHVS
jgi:GAF domain-containing protein